MPTAVASGRDVSGRGVQTTLLKLMEETEVPRRNPMDLQSQLQSAMEFQRRGKAKKDVINTRHILFICSGAFDRLKAFAEAGSDVVSTSFQIRVARIVFMGILDAMAVTTQIET